MRRIDIPELMSLKHPKPSLFVGFDALRDQDPRYLEPDL
jgi:hypothetical protein